MNPDVTDNITSSMSELQLQFLQHLKIQPLQSNLAAPDYQASHQTPAITASAAQSIALSSRAALQAVPSDAISSEPLQAQWIAAEASVPLVRDMLVFLQQAGVQAQWFYQAGTTDIQLSEAGLFSAPPQHFFTADSKKQLWRHLLQLLPAEAFTDTDPT
ncbi:MAG: hypothetical protein U5L02_11725 [Rheinheimera sp.]|nr:hypothetical protein [Rheinheimera sp.]